MVKLTVQLTDEAHAALLAAAERTGDTSTDTANRALVIYDAVTAALKDGPATLDVSDVAGHVGTLHVLRGSS